MSDFFKIKEMINQERENLFISGFYADLLHVNELLKQEVGEKYINYKLELVYICNLFMLGESENPIKLVRANLTSSTEFWELKKMVMPELFSHFKSVTEQLIHINYGRKLKDATDYYNNNAQRGGKKRLDVNKLVFSEDEIDFAIKKGIAKKIDGTKKDESLFNQFIHEKNIHCANRVLEQKLKMDTTEKNKKKKDLSLKIQALK